MFYLWSYGYRSRRAAEESLDGDISDGTMSYCEAREARISSYITSDGRKLWRVDLYHSA